MFVEFLILVGLCLLSAVAAFLGLVELRCLNIYQLIVDARISLLEVNLRLLIFSIAVFVGEDEFPEVHDDVNFVCFPLLLVF